MKNVKPEKTNTNLKKSYKALIKKMSTYDLRKMLKILYSDQRLGLNIEDLNKLPRERGEWYSKKEDVSITYDKTISDTLRLLGVIDGDKISKSNASLVIETVKSTLNLRATGKELPEDQSIVSIDCFVSDTSKNDYKIVINKDYEHPLDVSKTTGIWGMFLEMLRDGYLSRTPENKRMYDYLNFNKNNLITKNTKYPLQVIIKQSGVGYEPVFKGAVLTEKVLVRRQNNLANSA